MKSECSQEILNPGRVLERRGAWTFPEKSETKHLEYNPVELGSEGWVVWNSASVLQAIKKKVPLSRSDSLNLKSERKVFLT